MQISHSKPVRHGGRGFALIITMVFLLVSLIIFGSIMYWSAGNAKVTMRNNQFNNSEYAAEAAVETVLAQMERDFISQSLTNASFYQTLLPNQTNWPVGYQFSDTNGVANQISVYIGSWSQYTVSLNSEYTNLYGFVETNTITATATPASASGAGSNWVYNVPATVSEQLELASIPIFQFAIFYNINLEIAPGQPMTITGPVFCNQSIWEGAADTTYQNTVSAVGTNNTTTADPFSNGYTDTGNPVFSLALQPTSKNDALTMPIAGATNSSPTNVEFILQVPPAAYAMGTAAAYTSPGTNYLANQADLIITNISNGTNWGSLTPSGTNIFVYYQDVAKSPNFLTPVTPDYYWLKKPWTNGVIGTFTNYVNTNTTAGIDSITNVQFAGYSFLTNALFYDWREGYNGGSGIGGKGKAVQAVQIDVSLFSKWATNTATNGGNCSVNGSYNSTCITHKNHPLDSMFVYSYVPLTTTTLPAVRVMNGQQMPSTNGFTVATALPLYVWKDYNIQQTSGGPQSIGVISTTYTYPAAFMADAITVLSDSWNDAITNKLPSPSSTTINAACLEGIVPTNPTISLNYSGGVENFLRLLENWSSSTLTYNGSIVVMFPSEYATNVWSYGNYYDAPARNWAFDTRFRQQSGLPPLTPQSKTVIRGQWLAY